MPRTFHAFKLESESTIRPPGLCPSRPRKGKRGSRPILCSAPLAIATCPTPGSKYTHVQPGHISPSPALSAPCSWPLSFDNPLNLALAPLYKLRCMHALKQHEERERVEKAVHPSSLVVRSGDIALMIYAPGGGRLWSIDAFRIEVLFCFSPSSFVFTLSPVQ